MRKLFTTAFLVMLASLMWGQANVDESQETAFYWVDAVAGSDANPGTQAQPFKTIGMGVAVAESNNRSGVGSKVTVNPGVYRESVSLVAATQDTALPITIEAATPGTVIMSGADPFTGWQPYSGNTSIYTTVWPYQYGLCAADSGGGPFEQNIVLRRELIVVNGVPLTQVLTLNQMQQGTFFVDESHAAVYIWPANGTSISQADVEVGTRDALLTITKKSDVVVRGMTFQYSNACRTGAALPVNTSNNILLDNDAFYWNNAQGPAMLQDSQFTVQNSIANHNGIGGMGDGQSLSAQWTNNTTNYNNWRGAQGAFYLWSSAGFHPYQSHGSTISGLTSAFNQTFGIHWDTDNRDVTADNLVLSENLLAEGFIEKSEGPITITNSYMCGGNPTTGPVVLGFEMRNSQSITMSGTTIANDGQGITLVGTAGGIGVTDWQTGQVYNLITQNVSLNNNVIVGGTGQSLFYDSSLGGTDWTTYLTSLSSDYNDWWDATNPTPFVVPVPANHTQIDFPTWQLTTLQDLHSTFAAPSGNYLSPCTLTPEAPDFWYVTDWTKSLLPISSGGSASFVTTATAFGGFNGAISLTSDGVQNIPGATSSWDTQTINTSGNATFTVNTTGSTPTGVYPVTMVANNGAVTRTITASVLVNTTLAVAPLVANLGSESVGSTTVAFPVTLANVGANAVNISSITTTGDFSQTNTCGTQVNGGTLNNQCSISVFFTPTQTGTRTGTLTIVDADAGSPQTVALTGVGSGVPAVTFTPASLTFPSTDTGISSAPLSVTLSNTGSGDLTINSISIGGTNQKDFGQTNTCPTTVSAGQSCTITVTFTPLYTGARSGTISVSDSASTQAQTVALSGTAVAPVTSLTPTSVAFGSQQVGTTSAAHVVTLQNTGTGPLYISSIALTGTNPGDFAQTNSCPISPASLAVGASCTISITFTPTATGSRVATVSVTDNSPGSPHKIYLSGSGTSFTVTLVPTTLTFSSQVVGVKSAAKTITLTNKGTTTLNISSISFNGTNSVDYGQTNTCGTTVPAAGTCTISVTFTPTGTGTRLATLQVFDNGNQSPQSASISGTGVQPSVSLSPTSLTYAVQLINTSSKTQKVTLTNTGTGSLMISGIVIGGTNPGDFSQTNGCPMAPATLSVNGSCTITVTFTPQASGTRSAVVTVTDNAPTSPQTVALSGTGTAMSVTPTSLTFTSLTVGHSSKAKIVTMTNKGGTSVAVSSVLVGGANMSDFVQTNTCGTSLGAGASCTVSVIFTPGGVGARSGNVTLTDSDPGSPQLVTLAGTGI